MANMEDGLEKFCASTCRPADFKGRHNEKYKDYLGGTGIGYKVSGMRFRRNKSFDRPQDYFALGSSRHRRPVTAERHHNPVAYLLSKTL